MMPLRKFRILVLLLWAAGALLFSINYFARAENFSSRAMVKEVEGYRNWTKVNAVPQLMPVQVATACVMPIPPTEEADMPGNPHREKFFTVYVNDKGRDAMLKERNPNFPEGSIIVKEKLPSKESRTPELLTVMIKRTRGFNPESGDWEYMVLDGAGTRIEGRGNLQNCQGCHVANRKTDYIFRTYLSYEAWNNLK
jgi:hypothetical protein